MREHAVIEMAKSIVASEDEEHGFADTRKDPNTGLQTYRKEVYPLKPDTQQEDYSKPAIPCPVWMTRYQHIAKEAAKIADTVLQELESKPQWTKFADKMPPAKTPIWISNPRNAVPGFQFQHAEFNAGAQDWIMTGWTHWMLATNDLAGGETEGVTHELEQPKTQFDLSKVPTQRAGALFVPDQGEGKKRGL